MHGSLEDHFLVTRIPWLNKVISYLLTTAVEVSGPLFLTSMPVEDFPNNLQFYQIPFLLQHQFSVVLIINCPRIYLGRVIFSVQSTLIILSIYLLHAKIVSSFIVSLYCITFIVAVGTLLFVIKLIG